MACTLQRGTVDVDDLRVCRTIKNPDVVEEGDAIGRKGVRCVVVVCAATEEAFKDAIHGTVHCSRYHAEVVCQLTRTLRGPPRRHKAASVFCRWIEQKDGTFVDHAKLVVSRG